MKMATVVSLINNIELLRVCTTPTKIKSETMVVKKTKKNTCTKVEQNNARIIANQVKKQIYLVNRSK